MKRLIALLAVIASTALYAEWQTTASFKPFDVWLRDEVKWIALHPTEPMKW